MKLFGVVVEEFELRARYYQPPERRGHFRIARSGLPATACKLRLSPVLREQDFESAKLHPFEPE